MGKIKKLLESELVGGTQNTDVYPVTSTSAVYNRQNKVLDDVIEEGGNYIGKYDIEEKSDYSLNPGYISVRGIITSSELYQYTTPIFFEKGSVIVAYIRLAPDMAAISLTDVDGSTFSMVKEGAIQATPFFYVVKEDGYYSFVRNKNYDIRIYSYKSELAASESEIYEKVKSHEENIDAAIEAGNKAEEATTAANNAVAAAQSATNAANSAATAANNLASQSSEIVSKSNAALEQAEKLNSEVATELVNATNAAEAATEAAISANNNAQKVIEQSNNAYNKSELALSNSSSALEESSQASTNADEAMKVANKAKEDTDSLSDKIYGNIDYNDLSESARQKIESMGGGSIVNNADEEDLKVVEEKLKFADREFLSSFKNKGYVILRKNKTFKEQVTKSNTIYEVRYNFDLTSEGTIIIPDGCTLLFNGGILSNGEIKGNFYIWAKGKVFDNTKINEVTSEPEIANPPYNILNEELRLSWFCDDDDDDETVTKAMEQVLSKISFPTVFLDKRNIYLTRPVKITRGKNVHGFYAEDPWYSINIRTRVFASDDYVPTQESNNIDALLYYDQTVMSSISHLYIDGRFKASVGIKSMETVSFCGVIKKCTIVNCVHAGIAIFGSENCLIERNYIMDCGCAIYACAVAIDKNNILNIIGRGLSNTLNLLFIKGNYFTGQSNYGIILWSGSDTHITDNTFGYTSMYAIYGSSLSGNCVIDQNYFEGCGHGKTWVAEGGKLGSLENDFLESHIAESHLGEFNNSVTGWGVAIDRTANSKRIRSNILLFNSNNVGTYVVSNSRTSGGQGGIHNRTKVGEDFSDDQSKCGIDCFISVVRIKSLDLNGVFVSDSSDAYKYLLSTVHVPSFSGTSISYINIHSVPNILKGTDFIKASSTLYAKYNIRFVNGVSHSMTPRDIHNRYMYGSTQRNLLNNVIEKKVIGNRIYYKMDYPFSFNIKNAQESLVPCIVKFYYSLDQETDVTLNTSITKNGTLVDSGAFLSGTKDGSIALAISDEILKDCNTLVVRFSTSSLSDLSKIFFTVPYIYKLEDDEGEIVDSACDMWGNPKMGTFSNKPKESNNIGIGFSYFCTDRKIDNGNNGIMIYHIGGDTWVDSLGRTIS